MWPIIQVFLESFQWWKCQNANLIWTGIIHSPWLFTFQNVMILVCCLIISVDYSHVCAYILNRLGQENRINYAYDQVVRVWSVYLARSYLVLSLSKNAAIFSKLKIIQTLNTLHFCHSLEYTLLASVQTSYSNYSSSHTFKWMPYDNDKFDNKLGL